MSLELMDVCAPLSDVARYVGKTPQTVSRYLAARLLVKKDRGSVTLIQFNRLLGRKFPHLPRFETVAHYDAWVRAGRPPGGVKDSNDYTP